MIRTTDRLIAPSRGSETAVLAVIRSLWERAGLDWGDADQVIAFVTATYDLAPLVGLDAALQVVQAAHETGSVIKGRWVPFTSDRFLENGNSGGFLIERDSDADPARFTGAEAAKVHAWALLLATRSLTVERIQKLGALPDSGIAFYTRWRAKYNNPADTTCPTVVTIDDLNIRYLDRTGEPQATWAWDATYQDQLVDRGRALFPTVPDQTDVPNQQGGTDVPAPMPTIPVVWNPVPLTNRNHTERKLLAGDLWIIWHENGVLGGSAKGENRFVVEDQGGSDNVSFHFAVDHTGAYQNFDLSWLCYHAADGCDNPVTDYGCFRGIAIEHVQTTDPVKWAATKRNGAILTAMIISGHPSIHFGGREGDFSAERITTHNKVSDNGKWCPQYMLNENAIPSQVASVKALVAGAGDPTPLYAERITTGLTGKDGKVTRKVTLSDGTKVDVVYDLFVVERPYEVLKRTNRRQGPDSRGPKVGPVLAVRESFTGTYLAVPRKQEGKKIPTSTYVITEIGTWILASALTPRVSVRAA